MPVLPRRTFLSAATAAADGFALACVDRTVGVPLLSRATSSLPLDPSSCGIEHVVVMMMENRSFDHFLGWLPDADGRQAGLSYLDSAGVGHPTYALAPDFQGCGHADPDHSYEGGRVEYNGGSCDGWLRVNDTFSIGYYRQEDLAFLGRAVPEWTSFDRYFCAILGPTFPNRIYQHAGQTDRLSNTPALSTLPTIWDRLAGRGLQGRYYYGDVPFLGLWGAKYLPISRPLDEFFADCRAGSLPQVAFVDGPFLSEATGTGPDDHPFGDIRAGEAFLNRIYAAVTASPAWERTVLHQLRRVGRVLRPRAAPGRGHSGRHSRRRRHGWAPRLPYPRAAHFSVRAPRAHRARAVRPYLGLADDRMALEPRAPQRARPDGKQSGAGAGLHAAPAGASRLSGAAGDGRVLPREPRVDRERRRPPLGSAARRRAEIRLECLGSGETEPTAVGKDHVARLPHQLHLVERCVPQALMREPERIDSNDPCRLASCLSGGEG